MRKQTRTASRLVVAVMLLAAFSWAGSALADDLTGSSRFLCAPVQLTVCIEDGECATDVPWNANIPQFIEVDLEARSLATTAASGENRATPIEHLSRHDGVIVLHGYEMERAFTWVIAERTGHVTAALATDGIAMAVFGACTPLDKAGKESAP